MADPRADFAGHELNCGSNDGGPSHWIGRVQVNQVGPDRNKDVVVDPASLHPTANGQRLGFEAAFRRALG